MEEGKVNDNVSLIQFVWLLAVQTDRRHNQTYEIPGCQASLSTATRRAFSRVLERVGDGLTSASNFVFAAAASCLEAPRAAWKILGEGSGNTHVVALSACDQHQP